MAKTRLPYAPEFRRQMVELVHAGRSQPAVDARDVVQQVNRQGQDVPPAVACRVNRLALAETFLCGG